MFLVKIKEQNERYSVAYSNYSDIIKEYSTRNSLLSKTTFMLNKKNKMIIEKILYCSCDKIYKPILKEGSTVCF